MIQHCILFADRPVVARLSAGVLAATLGLAFSPSVLATEGGIGRPVTGMQIAPYAGIVPPTDDWIVSVNSIFYEGSLSTGKNLAISGKDAAGLDYHISYNLVNAVKTWGITAGGWNFASSFGVPLQYTDVSSFHGVLPDDHRTQFADLFFTPVVAGYHLTKTDHIALSVQIYAPTGAYNTDNLANAGQNTWTFTPTFAYTKLFPKQNIELSVNYGVEFYTPDKQTGYHNAPVSVLDVLALKRFGGGGESGWWAVISINSAVTRVALRISTMARKVARWALGPSSRGTARSARRRWPRRCAG
jgi:hypothetical protein